MKLEILSAAFVLSLGLCENVAAAILGTLDVQYFDQGANRLVNNQLDADGDMVYEATVTGSAGAYLLMTQNPTGEAVLLHAPDLWSFCLEADQGTSAVFQLYEVHPVEDGPVGTTWRTAGPLTTGQANALRELWGRFYDPIWQAGWTDPDNDNAAAFGAALKEIVYETVGGPFDVLSGRFRLDPGTDATVGGIANNYLSQITGDPAHFADLRLLTNPNAQDYLVQIPEPASLLLVVLATLAARRRS